MDSNKIPYYTPLLEQIDIRYSGAITTSFGDIDEPGEPLVEDSDFIFDY